MYKRGGIWWTCIRHNGRKIQTSLETADAKLAQKIEARIKKEVAKGKYFTEQESEIEGDFTVADLIEKYLAEHAKPNKAENTYRKDIGFSKRILQHFGKMLLNEVSSKHIAKFINARRKDGVGNVMINHELQLLRHAYNLAIKQWELVEDTPFAKISIPKGDTNRVRYLSEDEEERLFEVLPDWLTPIVIIARETGLRRSNIAGLCWRQVNLERKIIIVETTKNKEPLGLPMTQSVFKVLSHLYQTRKTKLDFVFINNEGNPVLPDHITKSFGKVVKKAGIENFRFHDLRHDFCSRLVQRGIDIYTVAALAGHKDIKMTQRYAHLNPEKLRSAVEVLDKVDYNLTTVGQNLKIANL